MTLPYGALIRVRNHLYDRGLLPSYLTPPLVISVGNLETGGTGKTPTTIALAKTLTNRGHRVAIVTRGYRGRLPGVVEVTATHTAREVGDEALLMQRTSGVPVIKAPDRVAGALYASRLGCTIVVLDDGFQHRRIRRDLDIVLVSRDLTRARLLPTGVLREPVDSLARAHLVIATKGAPPGGLSAHLAPECLVDIHAHTTPLEALKDRRVLAFCGLARPQGFYDSLSALGARVEALSFRDHHRYTQRDLRRIQRHAQSSELVVTTEKDLVKLRPEWTEKNWYALRVGMQFSDPGRIIQEIEDRVSNRRLSR